MVVVACALALVACKKDSAATTSAAASAVASTPPPHPSTAPSAGSAAGPFEGEIVVSVKDEASVGVPASITYDVKGDKVRYAPAASRVRAVADVAVHKASAIDDGRKAFASFDGAGPAPGGSAVADAKITKSNFVTTIAGRECHVWSVEGGNEKADVCVATGIPFFDLASQPRAGKLEPSWAAALTREKAFPLQVVVHDKAGKEEYRAEATQVTAKRLEDASFDVPHGFTARDLSADVRTASLP
jgi:hypothetical protein